MKLSKLRFLCDKAIEKYGDMCVVAYSKDYACNVEKAEDCYDFKLRIISKGWTLPGEDLDEECGEIPVDYFACIFFED
jgi:hypothetical protein